MRRNVCLHAAALVAAALAAPVPAGPVWLENIDAPSLPSGGSGSPFGSGTLSKIVGAIQGAVLAGDFEDMYKIYISDPVNFRASTDPRDPIAPGCAEFDTQLFLFKPIALDSLSALGVLGNNDHPASNPGSPFSLLIPIPSDGSPVVSQCGIYYLAISGAGDVPLSPGGHIFFLGSPTEISGADGPGGPFPITGWSGGVLTGDYEIGLKGVKFGSCPWDCGDYNGIVGIVDFLTLLGQWGLGPLCNCDIDGGGVSTIDFLALLGHWGPCPGAPPSDSCCVAHADPGCSDAGCQSLVCGDFPTCCVVAWDPICAAQASVLCPACAPHFCSPPGE